MKAPRVIHQIWVGPREKPTSWMNTWRTLHPEWEYILWNEQNIQGFENQILIERCIEKGLYHAVADIVRYEVLYRYGGFVAPGDSECVRPIDELFVIEEDCFACYQHEEKRPGLISPHLGADQGCPLIRVLIDAVLQKKSVKEPWMETGNLLLTNTVKQLAYPIKIYPSHYFIPVYNNGEEYKGEGDVFAIHKWYTTNKLWNTQKH